MADSTTSPSEEEKLTRKLQHICTEILTSEKSYQDFLVLAKSLREAYKLNTKLNNSKDVKRLLNLLKPLIVIQRHSLMVIGKLDAIKNLPQPERSIKTAEILKEFAENQEILTAYCDYVAHHAEISPLLDKLQQENATFKAICEKFQSDQNNRPQQDPLKGQTIIAVLINPAQRIPRYKLLLEQCKETLNKLNEVRSVDAISIIEKSLKIIEGFASSMNEATRTVEKQAALKAALKKQKITDEDVTLPEGVDLPAIKNILEQQGYAVDDSQKGMLTVKDKDSDRILFAIKYKTNKKGRLILTTVCGFKEIQKFAESHIRYKARIAIKNAGTKLSTETMEQYQNRLIIKLEDQFPKCNIQTKARRSDKKLQKIVVTDKKGKVILVLKEDKEHNYHITKAQDPNQVFNRTAHKELLLKAVQVFQGLGKAASAPAAESASAGSPGIQGASPSLGSPAKSPAPSKQESASRDRGQQSAIAPPGLHDELLGALALRRQSAELKLKPATSPAPAPVPPANDASLRERVERVTQEADGQKLIEGKPGAAVSPQLIVTAAQLTKAQQELRQTKSPTKPPQTPSGGSKP